MRPREIRFNHGVAWKTVISTYIGAIPASSEAPCVEQIGSGAPPGSAVSTAIAAKVGAAARRSQPAAPEEDWTSPGGAQRCPAQHEACSCFTSAAAFSAGQ
jgi:hypothetical protein